MNNGIEINSESVLAKNFLENLLQGKYTPKDIIVPECGIWQTICHIVAQNYISGYTDGNGNNVKMAKAFALESVEDFLDRNPDLQILVGETVYNTRQGKLPTGKVKAGFPALTPMKYIDISGVEKEIDATFDYSLGKPARKWLDKYIKFSKQWSPRGHEDFHEAIGIWLLAAIAKKRIYIPIASGYSTNLYILLAAESSKFTKTGTMKIAESLLHYMKMDWLLLPPEMTTAFFYLKASGHVPENYISFPEEYREEQLDNEIRWCGQRSLVYDEIGNQLVNMATGNNPHKAGFNEVLLKWDGYLYRDSNPSIATGEKVVIDPYITLLASMTPESFRVIAQKKGADIWKTGLLARFVVLCPDSKSFAIASWPKGEIRFPREVVDPLLNFDKRLGTVKLTLEEEVNAKGLGTGKFRSYRSELPKHTVKIPEDVWKAFQNYSDALTVMCNKEELDIPNDLHASYSRLAEKTLRIAVLLSYVESNGELSIIHWVAAQEIAEKWRMNIHEFYYQTSSLEITAGKKQEINLVETLKRLEGWATLTEIRQRSGVSTEHLQKMLQVLVEANVIVKYSIKQPARGPKMDTPILYGLLDYQIPDKWASRIIPEESENDS